MAEVVHKWIRVTPRYRYAACGVEQSTVIGLGGYKPYPTCVPCIEATEGPCG